MQSFKDHERIRFMEKPRAVTPYSRRSSPSPYLFVSRNFDTLKGRIHDPSENEHPSGTSGVLNRSGKASVPFENFFCFPQGFVNRTGKNEGFGKNGENDIIVEMNASKNIRENQLKPKREFKSEKKVIHQKNPVQLIGKLSLAESKAWIPYGHAEIDLKSRSKETGQGKALGQVGSMKSKFYQEDHHFKRKEYQSRLLTGSVEKVLHWFELKNSFNLLLEVMAPLADIKPGKFPGEKCLVLREEITGPSLLVTFFEIDRPLPELVLGSIVRCIGRLITRNSLHAFRVEQSSEQEKADSHRLFFMSNLVAQEAKIVFGKKQ